MSNTLTRYGTSALAKNTTGANNSAFGHFAAYNNTDASCNTAIGSCSSFYNVHGKHNTAIGAGSMCNNVGGELNTAVGSSALEGPFPSGNVGDQNVAIGAQALYSNSGNQNVGVGCYALLNNTTGGPNTAVGYGALQANITGPNNTAIGYLALALNDASNNTAVGSAALANNTSGHYNTAVGTALVANETGILNTATGFHALLNNTTGYYNTSVGSYALFYNRDGSGNTAIGFEAGLDVSGNSNNNTFLGFNANVSSNTLIYNNSTALGCYATIDASNQIVLGTSNEHVKIPGTYVGIGGVYTPSSGYALDVSGNINFTGNLYKSGVIYPSGSAANYWTTDGTGTDISNNNTGSVGIGGSPNSYYKLDVSGNMRTIMDAQIHGLTVGLGGGNVVGNTAVGFVALAGSNTGTGFNTALGAYALTANTSGYSNTAVGYNALLNNISGYNNTAVGVQALGANFTSGSYNTAIGDAAGTDISGNYNTFLGYSTTVTNTTIEYNNSTALGYNATIDASNQIVLGGQNASLHYPGVYIPGSYVNIGGGTYNPSSGYALDVTGADARINGVTVGQGGGTGFNNTAVGDQALPNSSGNYNTAVGTLALTFNAGGIDNTAVGDSALKLNISGSYNTAIGQQALFNNIGSRNTALGWNAGINLTSGSNSNVTCIGNNAQPSSAGVDNEITLGDTNVLATNGLRCMSTTIISASDIRDKKNVNNLDAGLDFINNVRPVRFLWNMREGGTNVDIEDTGFIAQELKQAQIDTNINIPGLVVENNPDRLEAGYAKLLPILVKAVQELSAKVTILETELSELKK